MVQWAEAARIDAPCGSGRDGSACLQRVPRWRKAFSSLQRRKADASAAVVVRRRAQRAPEPEITVEIVDLSLIHI